MSEHETGAGLSRRAFLRRGLAGAALASSGSLLAACAGGNSGVPSTSSSGGRADLVFTYWGSPNEQQAVAAMVSSFNAKHPNIQVRAQYVANTGYQAKISSMLASGSPPDIAYMDPVGPASQWAEEGKLLNLTPYIEKDTEIGGFLPGTAYKYGNGKTFAMSLAIGTEFIFHRKDMFDAAGLRYPPTKASHAWTWDQFVQVAKRLTRDVHGNDATSSKFDPGNIQTYGVSMGVDWLHWLPLINSNGGRFCDDAGRKLLLDQPAAVDVLQKMQDLIYVHHAAPTPAQSATLPSTDVMMQSGKIAMDVNGEWKVLDYSRTSGLKWGMGVLPKFKQQMTIPFGIPLVIFNHTKHPDAAYEFYRFHYDPSNIDLYEIGLWQPILESSYTDGKKIAGWLDKQKGVYPPEARDVLIDGTLHHAAPQAPFYWLKNIGQIMTSAVTPSLDLLFTNKATAQQAMDQAAQKAAQYMQGRLTD
jgi:multiple sugar transport system substrate-binding protein